jgi:hypothetical protein
LNAPARPGDLAIVPTRRVTWTTAILTAIITVLAIAAAHLAQFGPGIDNPAAVASIGQHLCANHDGMRRITLRALPGFYTIHCRDGSQFADVKIDIREPQS